MCSIFAPVIRPLGFDFILGNAIRRNVGSFCRTLGGLYANIRWQLRVFLCQYCIFFIEEHISAHPGLPDASGVG